MSLPAALAGCPVGTAARGSGSVVAPVDLDDGQHFRADCALVLGEDAEERTSFVCFDGELYDVDPSTCRSQLSNSGLWGAIAFFVLCVLLQAAAAVSGETSGEQRELGARMRSTQVSRK